MILKKIFSFATLTLIVALTLSAIAAWYSVLGLTAIFAAAVVPIIIMGGSLEVAKVVTTVWLHRYWDRATLRLKLYLVPAVITLAFLTSMGIFGFLSKAHSDQALVSGDVTAKIELIDERIKISRDNIAMNQKALEQMNSQVDQLLGRTTDDTGANRAVQVRRQQASERARLNNEIAAEQETIAKLNEEAAPIRAEIRKVEAEVGPIKYIAAMIYGDNPDNNLLERAVRWVIILIVLVFDPLALMLVLAAQSSYKWLDEDLKNKQEEKSEDLSVEPEPVEDQPEPEPDNPEEPEGKDSEDKAWTEQFLNSKGTIDPDIDLEPTILTPEPEIIDPIEEETFVPGEAYDEELAELQAPSTTESVDIKTEGVTLQETDGGYVQYQGKSVHKNALLGMHPEFFAAKPDSKQSNTNFGTEFPKFAKRGDIFVRVDILPNRVFKFDGSKWIEVNKEQTDSYLYDEEYIKHLVSKIESGEYDVDLLSEPEREQIKEYLSRNG